MSNDTPLSVSPFAAHQQLLRERLHFLLTEIHPLLRADIICALEEPGKLLAQPQTSDNSLKPALPVGMWSLLPLLVAQHISPEIDPIRAGNVAVAVECFLCALDLLDDVEDDDKTSIIHALGSARALNISTALLMLTQRAVLSLTQHRIDPAYVVCLLDALQEAALVATAGQHRDLLAEQRLAQDLTYEECIEIAAGKAGSLMRVACRLGALCANAPDALCEQFSEMGELLGIAHQLDNDCHDLYYLLQSEAPSVIPMDGGTTTGSVKSDLVRGKKTLPVVLAARTNDPIQEIGSQADEEKREEHLRSLYEGIIAAWGICILYRERARDRLQAIEAQRPIDPVLRLLLGL